MTAKAVRDPSAELPGTAEPPRADGRIGARHALRSTLHAPRHALRLRPADAAAGLGDDLLGHALGHFLVVAGLHAVAGPALGHAADRGGVAEHLREGDVRLDHLGAALFGLHAFDPAAPAVQVA